MSIQAATPATHSTDDVDSAARRMYDAETALHAAHASHVDAWISAAADKLHAAIEAHLAAIAASSVTSSNS